MDGKPSKKKKKKALYHTQVSNLLQVNLAQEVFDVTIYSQCSDRYSVFCGDL